MQGAPTRSDFWAKLVADEGNIVAWHSLTAHSADVAAVTQVLLRETVLSDRFDSLLSGTFAPMHRDRLSVLAAIHDAGKASQHFQNRAFGKKPTGDHLTPIVGLLSSLEKKQVLDRALGLKDIMGWFGDLESWLKTTWSHHGWPVDVGTPDPGSWTNRSENRLSAFGDHIRTWYPKAFEGEALSLSGGHLQHLFNGVLTLADWIASDERFFRGDPDGKDLLDPVDAMEVASRRAEEAVGELHLDIGGVPLDDRLETILGGYAPYQIQREVQELPLGHSGSLTILESATGSGKTEAALGRFARLLRQGKVDSMYFAVPTRSAATQLQERVCEAADRMFDSPPPVHLAVPGYLRVGDVDGQRFGLDVRWDEPIGLRGWASESSKRYTASPIAVGTVDQVLLSALRTNHSHLRTAGLARSFLVVDEVHASSVYMNELLTEVLDYHRAMGGHAFLMSATLGARARAAFTGVHPPEYDEAQSEAYPLITHAGGDGESENIPTDAPSDGKRVDIETVPCIEQPHSIARRAEKAAEDGAHVLVIRNTVAACKATHRALDDRYSLSVETVPCPHHSRYAPADRSSLDKEIEEVYGKNEVDGVLKRPTEGGIVTIATQTVEQSLDIDADLLITDLCPIDVLLQRIGRLHRHDRPSRPEGHEAARCVVAVPPERDLTSKISSETGRGYPGPGLGSVYGDLRIIEATWRALSKREENADGQIQIPRDNRALVEEATHPSVIEEIESQEGWERHASRVRQMAREETLEARNNLIDREKPFTADENQFPGHQLATRLGDEDVHVELPEPCRTPFGNQVQEMALSPYLFDERPGDGQAELLGRNDGTFQFSFAGHQFEYTSLGICTS